MLLTPLFTLTIIYFFFLHPFFTLNGIFCSPYSPDDDIISVHNHPYLNNNLAFSNPVSPPHTSTSPSQKPRKSMSVFGRGNAIATGVIIVITLLNIVVYKLRKLHEENLEEKLDVSLSSSTTEQVCRRFSLAEIKLATHNFDDSLVIGQGGFGKVYRGLIDNGSRTVAIKRLNRTSKQGAPEFWNEIDMLSRFRHSHLILLIGYCESRHEMILVYEYMVRGTFADHLYKISSDNSPLSWVQRLKICIGAARGLDYLHTGTGVQHRVIHRDVKSSNILLDENWMSKISDFGMSKIGPANQAYTTVNTAVKGTCGYLDPEYFLTHTLTRKSDVYAFGVVLFEALCGRPAVDLRLDLEQRSLAGWVQHCIKEGRLNQIIDPTLKGKILPNCLTVFTKIGGQCLYEHKKKRPTMAEVVAQLESALAMEERQDSSIIEWDIFNGAYENQDNANSFIEQEEVINDDNGMHQEEEVINANNGMHQDEPMDEIIRLNDASNEQSHTNHAKLTLTGKARLFFSGTTRVVSGVRKYQKKIKKLLQSRPKETWVDDPFSDSFSGMPIRFSYNALQAATNDLEGVGVELGVRNYQKKIKKLLQSRPKETWVDDPFSDSFSGMPICFSYNALQAATNDFSVKLGRGGFGSVYQGVLPDGVRIAVKELEGFSQGKREFQAEVSTISSIHHRHLVRLKGFCAEGTHHLLAYEYMSNGSLDKWIFRKNKENFILDWDTRFNIAVGTAKGLAYLHEECGVKIIHCDIKPENVLLDDSYIAKVSNFGLATLTAVERSQFSTIERGTRGYLEPEWIANHAITEKVDVYSYGMLLLEIIGGRKNMEFSENADNTYFPFYAFRMMKEGKLGNIIDSNLEINIEEDERVFIAIQVAFWCIQNDTYLRPTMGKVVHMLEGLCPVLPPPPPFQMGSQMISSEESTWSGSPPPPFQMGSQMCLSEESTWSGSLDSSSLSELLEFTR